MDSQTFRQIFADLPTLETKRLILKKIEQDNAADMYAYSSLNEVCRYLLWTPHINLEDTRGYIDYLQKQYKRGRIGDWGLNCKEDGRFIGTCGFADVDFNNNKAELGYVLSPAYQGKGYMSEAVRAVLQLAFFDLGFQRVELRIMEGNTASRRFAAALGFREEGILQDSLYLRGSYRTIVYYAMLRSEFLGIG